MSARPDFSVSPLMDIIAKRGAKMGTEVWYNKAMAKGIQANITTLLSTHPEKEVTFCYFPKWDGEVCESLMDER